MDNLMHLLVYLFSTYFDPHYVSGTVEGTERQAQTVPTLKELKI